MFTIQLIISAKILFQKIMHYTIQTKFTDQTTVIMKLKPMHVILYQKKKFRQHRNEDTSNMCIKIDLHLKLCQLKNTIHLHGMFI